MKTNSLAAPASTRHTQYIVCLGETEMAFVEICGKAVAINASEDYPASKFDSMTAACIALMEYGCDTAAFKIKPV